MAVEPQPGEEEARERHRREARRLGLSPASLSVRTSLDALRERLAGEGPERWREAVEEKARSLAGYIEIYDRHEVDDTVENVERIRLERLTLETLLARPDLLEALRSGDPGAYAALEKARGA